MINDELFESPYEHVNPNRVKLIEILGGFQCRNCGFLDWRALQIDHVYGNGKEMKLTNPGIMQFYLENPDIAFEDLQILCANCNWIKRYNNREVRR